MSEAATPDVLEVYVGSFGAPSYGLWWDGERLVYESFVSGYEERRQTFILPSEAQWTRFWRTLDAIDVWNWSDRYERETRREPAAEIHDGTHWSLSLAYRDRQVTSGGDDAAPASEDVAGSGPFAAFAEAVSRLTGGYPFGYEGISTT